MAIYLNWVSDAGLVKKTLTGNREAFGVLVERHLPMAHALAWSHTGGGADADDIVQDAFLRAFVKLDALREGEKFAGWLAGIVRNLAADARQRQSRIDTTPVEQLREAPSPVNAHEDEEIYALLRNAVAMLEEPAREVLTLHYFARKSLREVAEIQGITREAAMKRLQRAREALGKQLLDKLDGAPVSRQRMDARKKAVLALIASAPVAWKAAAATGISGATIAAVVALLALLGAGGFAGYTAIEAQRRAFADSVGAAVASATAVDTTGKAAASPESASPAAPASEAASADAPSGNCRVRGKVMDINGAPVKEALVRLELVNWDDGKIPPKTTRRYEVSSDASGAFEVTGLAFGVYSIMSFYGNAADVIRTSLSERFTERDEELYLKPCLAIAGRVVDSKGAPVPGAVVMPHTYVPMGPINDEPVTSAVRVIADDEGKFRFGLLWYGGWRLQARAEARANTLSAEVQAGDQNVVITMLGAATVTGHVTQANTEAPAEGVEVRLVNTSNFSEAFTGKTVSDGSFSIAQLAPATYRVEISGGIGGIQGGAKEIILVPEQQYTLDLVVGGGGTISGRVYVSDTGVGLAGKNVYLYSYGPGSFNREVVTDSLGGYFFPGIPEGTYQLGLGGDGEYFDPAGRSQLPIPLSGDKEVEVDFPLVKGVPISGTVVDAAGSPVADANIRLSELQTSYGYVGAASADSKLDGSFTVWARPGSSKRQLLASKGQLSSKKSTLSTLPAEGLRDVRVTLDLLADGGIDVKIDVKGLEQQLAAQLITAALYPEGTLGESLESVRVAPNGGIRFKNLLPGGYYIMLSNNKTGMVLCQSKTIAVPKGKIVTEVDFPCTAAGDFTMAGSVVDEEGRPIAGAKLRLDPQGPAPQEVITKADGNYLFEGLREGQHSIEANAEGFVLAHASGNAGDADIVIQMAAAQKITGRVLRGDTGEPVTNFNVEFVPATAIPTERNELLERAARAFRGQQFNRADGTFELEVRVAASGYVLVGAKGLSPEARMLSPEAATPLEFHLSAGRALTGHVFTPEGQPRPGVRVNILDSEGRFEDFNGNGSITDIDGVYTLDHCEPGVVLVFSYPDYAVTRRVAPEGNQLDVTLEVGGSAVVRFKSPPPRDTEAYAQIECVVGANGRPLVGKLLELQEDGSYRADNLPTGPARVSVHLMALRLESGGMRRVLGTSQVDTEIATGRETAVALELPTPQEPEALADDAAADETPGEELPSEVTPAEEPAPAPDSP